MVFAIGSDGIAHHVTVTYSNGGHVALCGSPARGAYLYEWHDDGLPGVKREHPTRRIEECVDCWAHKLAADSVRAGEAEYGR